MTGTMMITGASSGIGKATAEAAMAAGWKVGLVARRKGALEDVAASGDALVLPANVTSYEEIDGAVAQMVEKWGRLDAVFNNAGISTPAGLIDEIDLEDWTRTVNVNLTGMFYTARAAFGQMRRQEPQGGRIINNGSISAHTPREGSVCYTATKHGVTGLTKTLSLDGRPYDICCGQIDIGNAKTEMVADQQDAARAAGKTPDPAMDVRHAAEAVVHMASLPLDANVLTMTVMTNRMKFVGRG